MKISDLPEGTLLIGKNSIKGKCSLLLKQTTSKEYPIKILWLTNNKIVEDKYSVIKDLEEEWWELYLP